MRDIVAVRLSGGFRYNLYSLGFGSDFAALIPQNEHFTTPIPYETETYSTKRIIVDVKYK